MKKSSVVTVILICLMSLSVVCIQPIKAQYQGNITINTDGNISPSSAPIQQRGNIYTLTSDVNGSITVNRSDMVLDGNGHTIIYSGSDPENVLTISLNDVSNVTVKNFNIIGGWDGIAFLGTSCLIANNTITGTGNGIYSLDEPTAAIGITGDANNITGNTLINNYDGIVFYAGTNNLIVGNTIEDTVGLNGISSYGLMFWGASNNTIYHNNFFNNSEPQAGDATFDSAFPVNIWDDGYPGGGNYWSDYQTRYPDATMIGSSGIGDTPYVIDGANKDRYPLMEPFNASFMLNYAQETTPPKISVISPANQTYNRSSVPLVFSANKAIAWAGYSLDGEQNVTLIDNTTITDGTIINDTLANVTSGFHSITVYANNTFGYMGASENITFLVKLPELSKPFPNAPVAAALGTSAVVVVGAGLLVYFKKRKR